MLASACLDLLTNSIPGKQHNITVHFFKKKISMVGEDKRKLKLNSHCIHPSQKRGILSLMPPPHAVVYCI